MEPNTLIVSALAAGATVALKETASQAAKDAYSVLKTAIQKLFVGKPEAERALVQHEADPEVGDTPLRDALAATGAHKDELILEKAVELLKLLQPQQVGKGKYNVQIAEGQGVVIGDYAKVNLKFTGKCDK